MWDTLMCESTHAQMHAYIHKYVTRIPVFSWKEYTTPTHQKTNKFKLSQEQVKMPNVASLLLIRCNKVKVTFEPLMKSLNSPVKLS